MKTMLLTLCLVFSTKVFASVDLSKVSRCNWGYKNTAIIIDKDSRDEFYPGEVTSWELCKLALDPDSTHEGSDWAMEALSFLEIPTDQLRPTEMLTKKGQCEIGSILFQKKFLTVHDHIAIKLTAEGVCRSLPKSFN